MKPGSDATCTLLQAIDGSLHPVGPRGDQDALVIVPALVALLFGKPFVWSFPELAGFSFVGGRIIRQQLEIFLEVFWK